MYINLCYCQLNYNPFETRSITHNSIKSDIKAFHLENLVRKQKFKKIWGQ